MTCFSRESSFYYTSAVREEQDIIPDLEKAMRVESAVKIARFKTC